MLLIEDYFIPLVLVLILTIVTSGLTSKGRYVRLAGYLVLACLTVLSYVTMICDLLSFIMAMLTLTIGLITSMYTDVYERLKYQRKNLHILVDIFVLSTYMVFVAPALLIFSVCWVIASIVGFFAIIYETGPETWRAGLRYIVVSMLPSDVAILTLIACFYIDIGDLSKALSASLKYLPEIVTIPEISFILMLGFSAKAAIIPLHFWLPDAHSLAPSPTSALLSGVLVKMGIYGLLRVLPVINSASIPYAFMVLATITAVYGGLLAIIQEDIKRILAYSTIENMGLIVLSAMLFKVTGLEVFNYATLSLIVAHALFKSALFLNSGSVEVHVHTRNISKLGYLARVNALLASSALISLLSLIGVPPTIGFIAKMLLIVALINYVVVDPVIGVIIVGFVALALALSLVYSVKYLTIYWGTWSRKEVEIPSEAKLLVKWEYLLALLNVISPLTIPLIPLIAFPRELIAPLVISTTFFIVVLIYFKSYVEKQAIRDLSWLGGALP